MPDVTPVELGDTQIQRGPLVGGGWFCRHMSNEKKPGCLGFIGDYTIQLYGDYITPL